MDPARHPPCGRVGGQEAGDAVGGGREGERGASQPDPRQRAQHREARGARLQRVQNSASPVQRDRCAASPYNSHLFQQTKKIRLTWYLGAISLRKHSKSRSKPLRICSSKC